MSFDVPPGAPEPQPPSPPRATRNRSRLLLPVVVVVGVLIAGFGLLTNFVTDLLWYRSVGFSKVFTTELLTKTVLFVLFGLIMAAAIVVQMVVAYRTRPIYAPMSLEQQGLERYRRSIAPYQRLLVIGIGTLFGLIAGSSAAAEWRTWLLFRNSTDFGTKDAQFGRDVSYYAFQYPFWRFLLGFGVSMAVLSLLVAAVAHYLYGGIRLQTPGEKTTTAARVHLSVLLGVFMLIKAAAYWLDRYALAFSDRGVVTGPAYTDVNALLPAKTILAAVAIICAGLFFANIWRRGWILPGLGVGLLVLCAVLIGGVYPAIVQQFRVKPSEATREAPYIDRMIDGTRAAYDIVPDTTQYNARTTATAGQLRNDAETIPGIRLLDPTVVPPTYTQLQQVRGYYDFPDTLDVDRYTIDGRRQDSVVALREVDLSGVPEQRRNWINEHLVYTHGFGFVSAEGNTVDDDGNPVFTVGNIPPEGQPAVSQPRVYFGERSPEYSIVGAPEGTSPRELDYPSEAGDTGQVNNTYTGKGGVPIGSFFSQLLYAVKFQEGNILLSDGVNSDSRILYDRHPRDRIQKVAPYLTVDGDPYPAVIDGRITWIVDAYTTTSRYPYSESTTLGEATADTLTQTTTAVQALEQTQVNYIRNSVKATIDAYDGTVTLYQWDQQDPVLKTWMKAFPGTVKSRSEISDDLLAHLRYPEDMFKVQRTMLSRYHVTDPNAFYGGQDFWRVPSDPTRETGTFDQPPYYLSIQMPGTTRPSFSLTTTFVPNRKENLAAFMAINAEAGDDYGTMRVLQLPSNTVVPGPGQVQNQFEADTRVSSQLSLLRRGGSRVVLGNLLTLPVGGGLLYVEPVYVQAVGATSYPLLQKVLVSFGNSIGFEDTLQQSLDSVFSGDAGTDTGESGGGTTTTGGGGSGGSGGSGGTNGQTEVEQAQADLTQALVDANAAIQEGERALAQSDFAAYGESQDKLKAAVEKAQQAEVRLARATGAPESSPSPSPSPSPSG